MDSLGLMKGFSSPSGCTGDAIEEAFASPGIDTVRRGSTKRLPEGLEGMSLTKIAIFIVTQGVRISQDNQSKEDNTRVEEEVTPECGAREVIHAAPQSHRLCARYKRMKGTTVDTSTAVQVERLSKDVCQNHVLFFLVNLKSSVRGNGTSPGTLYSSSTFFV
jgi:hypothetical protein